MEKETALKVLKELHGKSLYSEKTALETFIPELRESEDERIRKAIVNVFKTHCDYEVYFGVSVTDILAWLEKQGEPIDINPSEFDLRLNKLLKQFETLPKEELASSLSFYLNVVQNNGTYKQGEQKLPIEKLPSEMKTIGESLGFTTQEECDEYNKMVSNLIMSADKVQPKFKVGDWIVTDKNHIWLIDEDCSTTGYSYRLISQNGKVEVGDYNIVDEHARLWTIRDAKDGGVLREDSCTFIIERMNPDGTAIVYCCLFDDGDFDLGSTLSFDIDSTKPATKEQRDFFFQKMKEKSYEWNAEKKELKKIKLWNNH